MDDQTVEDHGIEKYSSGLVDSKDKHLYSGISLDDEGNRISDFIPIQYLTPVTTVKNENGFYKNSKYEVYNSVTNKTEYNFDDENSLSFSTRRNRELNLTEYYNLLYEYKNDCLTAGIRYKKRYYNDVDIIPNEELFFSITIVPLGTFSPDKMVLNKNRID